MSRAYDGNNEVSDVPTSSGDGRENTLSSMSAAICDTSEYSGSKRFQDSSPVQSGMDCDWKFAEARPSCISEWAAELNQIEEFLDKKSSTALTTSSVGLGRAEAKKERSGLAIVRPRTCESSKKPSPCSTPKDGQLVSPGLFQECFFFLYYFFFLFLFHLLPWGCES
jgi:hypothetical protein